MVHCVKKLDPSILRRRAEYPQSSTRVIRAGTNTLSELRKHTEHTTYHGEHRNQTANMCLEHEAIPTKLHVNATLCYTMCYQRGVAAVNTKHT